MNRFKIVFFFLFLLSSHFVLASTCPTVRKSWEKLIHWDVPCTVSRVIDGDTTHVHCNGKKEKLRLVGIDTPETKHPFKPVEYFGPEASARAKELLTKGMTVCLSFSKYKNGRLPRGRYGRVLAYLFYTNGKMFNSQMVREGFAFAMTRYPHPYMKRFVSIENKAKQARSGMWKNAQKVKEMEEGDQAYRRLRKECKIKLSSSNFNWVIGHTLTKMYVTKRHGFRFFKTDPNHRKLFCSEEEARKAGYVPSSGGRYADNPVKTVSIPFQWGRSPTFPWILVDRNTKKYYVLSSKRYVLYKNEEEARSAGLEKSFHKPTWISNKKRKGKHFKQALGLSLPPENCRIVGNKRSKKYRLPTQKSYAKSLRSKNRIFFCTEEEALQKGYKRTKR